ncbi:hypothetical protein [Hydrogenimonas sp.]
MADPLLRERFRRSLEKAYREALHNNGIGEYLRILEYSHLDRELLLPFVQRMAEIAAISGPTPQKRDTIYRAAARLGIGKEALEPWLSLREPRSATETKGRRGASPLSRILGCVRLESLARLFGKEQSRQRSGG